MISKNKGAVAAISSVATIALLTSCSGGESGGTVSGEGATSQQKAMEHFSQILSEGDPAITFNYTGSGSGDGVSKFLSSDVDFAGSDSALDEEEAARANERCGGNPAWHLPMVIGPVAIAYNLDGVDDLVLNPAVLAGIYKGEITTWDAPEITALNPGKDLPGETINPVFRSDSSGTTDNFQWFLASSAPDVWGEEHSKDYLGTQTNASGAAGSPGVAQAVGATANSITYVEWGFATTNDLSVAQIDFGDGPVELSGETAGNALNGVAFAEEGSNDLVVDTEALFASRGADAYPLLLTPYSIVCSTGYSDDTISTTLQESFNKVLTDGQEGLEELGFVPLPDVFKSNLQRSIDALADGSAEGSE